MAGQVADLTFRSRKPELLDVEDVSDATLAQAYRELQSVNRWLGNTRAVLRLLRRDAQARVRSQQTKALRVLDLGCGQGALLAEIREKLGADVVGMDLRPVPIKSPIPIISGNAVTDSLPIADVAVCVLMAHHLTEAELTKMIGNIARSCDRLILLDLVRARTPLWLFRIFVAPWLCRINVADGQTSIQRAYTAAEMNALVGLALERTPRGVVSVQYRVAPLWIRQVVDIRWEASGATKHGELGDLNEFLAKTEEASL